MGHSLREQRRRLIITGLATPTLLSLPSRRVWASKCTKSKLLSGNLSLHGKKLAECEIACSKDFWKSSGSNWPGGGPTPLSDFETELGVTGVYKDNEKPTMQKALEGSDKVKAPFDQIKGDMKDLNKEAAAAYLNAVYLNVVMPMVVGFVVPGYEDLGTPPATSPARVRAIYADAIAQAKSMLQSNNKSGAQSLVKSIEALYKNANSNKSCPIA